MSSGRLVLRGIWTDLESRDLKILCFHLDGEGVLERGLETPGKVDAEGRPIEGSAFGNTVELDVREARTKLLLQRELDFWLKGIGRKPKKTENQSKESAPPSTSQNR